MGSHYTVSGVQAVRPGRRTRRTQRLIFDTGPVSGSASTSSVWGAQNWTPFQQLEFAAEWNGQGVHFSEIRFLGTLEADNLRKVGTRMGEGNMGAAAES